MHSKKHGGGLAKLAATYRAAPSVTDESILSFYSSLNCPMSLSCWILYKYKEHQQLLDRVVRPEQYLNWFDFRDAFAASSFLSKSNFLKVDIDRSEVAYTKFLEYETLCGVTNYRFNHIADDPYDNRVNSSLFMMMKKKISDILGSYNPDEWFDKSNWGPGVTTLLKGEEVSAFNKFHDERGITRDLYSLVGPIFEKAYPNWYKHLSGTSDQQSDSPPNIPSEEDHWVNFQIGNQIVTVPKNSKTDRVIAIEPGLNLWFQKGLGRMIRDRLLRHGIDLTDQTLNQRLAKKSSLDDSSATVDFSSASDSISTEVVRAALPGEWFVLLDTCRSKVGTRKDSSPIRWKKFSSMGNGFTFELESLLFFAAAHSVCSYLGLATQISVFGDDVILPKEAFELFSSFSSFLGFRVNEKKSFSSGPFRESCGAYYYEGVDVKPIFLKERVNNVQAIFKLANSVRGLAHRRNSYYGCDARFHHCWRSIHRRVPQSLRLGTSRELGDAGFAVNFDEACPPRAKDGIEGFRPLALLEIGVSRHADGSALLLTRLKVPSFQAYGNNYTLRGRSKIRLSRVLVHQWYNFGPWY